MAVFVLLSTSARTRIIAPHCLFSADRFAFYGFASILLGSGLLIRIIQVLFLFADICSCPGVAQELPDVLLRVWLLLAVPL